MKKTQSYTQARGGYKITGGVGKAPFMESVQSKKNPTNPFDLTHHIAMTGQMGKIMPISIIECAPGETHNIGAQYFTRFAPTTFPVFQMFTQKVICGFVPKRLLWENYETFLAGEATGGMPTIQIDNTITAAQQQFLDYCGIPPFTGAGGANEVINAMPIAAYQKMYEDLFRDQNFVPEVDYALADGAQSGAKTNILLTQRLVSYNRDYFTSMLPSPQAGTDVEIPAMDIVLDPSWTAGINVSQPNFQQLGGTIVAGALGQAGSVPLPTIEVGGNPPATAYDPQSTLIGQNVTINAFRRALELQAIKEMFMRGGRKFKELIMSAFGVDAGDSRLDRTEYVFGVKSAADVSEVLNTTGAFDPTLPTDPASRVQGDMAGHITVNGGDRRDGQYFTKEHGYLVFVTFVTPQSSYSQGIEKMYYTRDWTEEIWPQFAHLGEQPVKKSELVAYETGGADLDLGYLPIYSQHRVKFNRIAGRFRDTLAAWTLSRQLDGGTVALNQEFIEVDPTEQDRIFAVQTANNDNLYMSILLTDNSRKQLPTYGTPQI